MSYVILAGPTLAIDPYASRYYSVLTTDTLEQLGTIEVHAKSKINSLSVDIDATDPTELGYVMAFVTAVAKQFKGQSIIACGTDAVVLATALSNNVASKNTDIVNAWTNLNFVVEASQDSNVTDGKATTARFVGTNISGLKAIINASCVKFTITAK
jgi:hypothetical protein